MIGLIGKIWKPVAIIVAILALVAFLNHQIGEIKKKAYTEGVTAEKAHVRELIEVENKANRKFELVLQNGLNSFATRYEQRRGIERVQEKIIEKRITTRLQGNPDWSSEKCSVDEKILADRNAIRELGPGPAPTEGDVK